MEKDRPTTFQSYISTAGIQAKTPPFISITNENGVRVDIQATEDQSKRINTLIAALLKEVPLQLYSTITHLQDLSLTALADRSALQILNNDLVQKQKKSRKSRTKKHFGEARQLTVEEALQKMRERNAKDQEVSTAKERAAALRGKGRFAKLAWKDLAMSFDVFI
ncbi:uncharacterized protein BDZ99DRAFT_465704 [Mytilinidion resinicola]|uniref:Uncharacterized protein n=1 Tax=Mytilinidion resinicola TaxID=574789 RepID=A0A6A6YEK4_9PEZI|nr:uncharacterized protein BDZ99DRAFT_465704 [Mytilinidion resinicola]KAF2806953.1 hypothetical protein BDZ99DRAFT_465704 [Mytilinidion resinicola]